jgi:T4 beta protein
MFGPKHYIPILRSKDGEMYALQHLLNSDRPHITPLVEITPGSFRARWRRDGEPPVQPEPGEVLAKQAKKLLGCWGYNLFFLDLWHVDSKLPLISGQIHPLTYIANLMRAYKLHVVPVTGIGRSDAYQSAIEEAVRKDARGACVRIRAEEVLTEDLSARLGTLLERLNINETSVDLLIDYGRLDEEHATIKELLERTPKLLRWRSLTVASGAFPKDLQGFRPGSHLVSRADWLNWRGQVLGRTLPRNPSFADYSIQYGEYVEPVDNCNPSASIRYTLEDQWLIMRGEALRSKNKEKGPGSAQWVANAMLLRDRDDFFGAEFSEGDAYISRMSTKTSRPYGSPMTWIRAGLNHHLTVVSRQIASLSAL